MPIAPINPRETSRRADTTFQRGVDTRATIPVQPDLSGVDRALDTASQIVLDKQRQDNQREAKELGVQFSNRKREILWGENGYYSQRGSAAVEGAGSTDELLQRTRQEMMESASNPKVAQMFGDVTESNLQSERTNIAKFTENQRRAANKEASQARMQTAIEDAADLWNDQEATDRTSLILAAELSEQAERGGWEPEVLQRNFKDAESAMFQGMVTRAIQQGNPTEAKAILDSNKGRISSGVRNKLESQLKVITQLEKTQAESDRIFDSFQEDPNKALAEARKIKDPLLRRDTVRDLNNRFSEKARFDKRQNDAVAADLFQGMYSQDPDERVTFAQWAQENPEKAAEFAQDDALMGRIFRAETAIAKRQSSSSVSDGETLNSLLKLDPADLMEVDPILYQADLTAGEQSRLQSAINGARRKIERLEEGTAVQNKALRFAQRMRPELNWNRSSATKKQQEQQVILTNAINAAIEEEFIETKTIPTNAEIQRIVRLQTQEVEVVGSSFIDQTLNSLGIGGTESRRLASLLEQEGVEDVADIENVPIEVFPEDQINQIRKLFRENGNKVDPTEEQLQQYLAASILGDGRRQERLLGLIR